MPRTIPPYILDLNGHYHVALWYAFEEDECAENALFFFQDDPRSETLESAVSDALANDPNIDTWNFVIEGDPYDTMGISVEIRYRHGDSRVFDNIEVETEFGVSYEVSIISPVNHTGLRPETLGKLGSLASMVTGSEWYRGPDVPELADLLIKALDGRELTDPTLPHAIADRLLPNPWTRTWADMALHLEILAMRRNPNWRPMSLDPPIGAR
jgi:hypothetical protein